jgi:predicted phosphodiesterase
MSRNRKLALFIAFLAGSGVGLLALSFVPPSRYAVGPAVLSVKTRPGGPYTELALPPLGTVQAGTHPAPVSIELALAELDINKLQEIIGDSEKRRKVRSDVEDDLGVAARGAAVRTTLITLVGGAIGGALLPWRKLGDVAAGAAGGLVAGLFLVLAVASTFDMDAFEEPKFTGALTRAPAVLRTLQRQQLSLSALDSRFATAAERLSELMELVATPRSNPHGESIALLHVSDIHSNPLGISLTRQLVRRFNVDAVIDSGDLTSFGEPIEANVARRVADIDVPYIYVPGNHDSLRNQEALARINNVHLLHDDSFDVRGTTVFGWRDPTFTVWDAISTDEANDIRKEEGESIADAVEQAGEIDILVVHDRRLAEASEGLVPLVLSGHTHERDTTEGEDTHFLTVGSTGATGLEFFVEGARPYEAEIVYFRGDQAVTLDYVTFTALGEEFEIDRQRLDR